ncbi:MAG: NAD(P)/FAD-dependent oxidoreductase [Candidatus Zixiibacteriota bacterium]
MRAEVVVIGGGIIGSSIAYELAKMGIKDIIVLDKSYISSGATGRCGAGVRQQWGTEMNCRLARASVEIFEKLTEELGMDIEFRQGGYLSLIENENQLEQFEKNIELQNRLDIPSRLIDTKEALEIVPYLDKEKFIKAAYCPTDGHANPFLTNFAYAKAAEKLGVKILKYTEATSIEVNNGQISAVKIKMPDNDTRSIETSVVVNAAGGYSHEVAKMAGIDIDTYSERHQILVTEPLERLFDCMVISFVSGIYVQQVPHGSFVLGIGEKEEPSHNIKASWDFLEYVTKHLTSILPFMKKIRIVRQWAGLYNKTPDAQPIIGEHEDLDGFYNAVGFSGHGFMISPITAKIIAQLITGEKPSVDISSLNAKRFEKGELFLEPSVVG